MFRNSYDNDSVTYSPTGRLFQVEYALEAIKQGSATVGLVSRTHVVLVALKRNADELGSYQRKITRIDDNLGFGLAGLAPDARLLANRLRTLSMQERLLFDRPLAVNAAIAAIAEKAQANTQQYGRRPYGVGLLIAGTDAKGPHLFEFLPSGSQLEYIASAIGARSQAARTYLESHLDEFADSSLEQLIVHGLVALRDTLPQDKELTFQNTSIAVVGVDQDFTMLEDEDVSPWLDRLDSTARRPQRRTQAEGEAEDDASAPAPANDESTSTEAAEPTDANPAPPAEGGQDNEDDRMEE